jgi:hypothetical protein
LGGRGRGWQRTAGEARLGDGDQGGVAVFAGERADQGLAVVAGLVVDVGDERLVVVVVLGAGHGRGVGRRAAAGNGEAARSILVHRLLTGRA